MASTVEVISSQISKDIEKGFKDLNSTFRQGDIVKVTTAAIDLASIADGAALSTVITDATGVVIGDVVLGVQPNGVAADAIHAAKILICASVTDADEITVTVGNHTGGAVDAGSQTFTVLVMKLAGS